MDRVTTKMAAGLAASLIKSRTGRRVVAAVVTTWALLVGVALLLPPYLTAPGSSTMYHVFSCAAGVVGGGGGDPRPTTDPTAALDVQVASWNTFAFNSTSGVVRGIEALDRAGADVIGLQEVSTHAKRQALRSRLTGWGFTEAEISTPIAWRTSRYDLVAQGSVLAFRVERIEPGGSGTSIGPRSMQWAQLRDRTTRAMFVVLNDHKVPTIENQGRPVRSSPRRLALYERQDAVVATTIQHFAGLGSAVVKTGDENVGAVADAKVRDPLFPYARMQARGMYSNWRTLGYPDQGNDGGRLIDYVWANAAVAAPVAQRILGRSGSDHAPVLVQLTNQRSVAALKKQQGSNVQLSARAVRAVDVAGAGAGGSVEEQQIANARLVEQGVRTAGGSGRAVYVALVVATGESDLINVNFGDKAGPDSRGLFQQRDPWGTLAQRMDPAWAAGAFMLGPHQAHVGGLLQLPGWQDMPVTLAAHKVQRNADPQHYARFEARAQRIGEKAGVDFDAPAGAAPALLSGSASGADCAAAANPVDAGSMPPVGTGSCPLDGLYAPGHRPGRDCDGALAFLQQQMSSGSTSWYRQCLALVMQSYGYSGGAATAYQASQEAAAAGRLSFDRSNIPRGAILYWDGRPTGNSAGHVAVYDGSGYIFSNDVTGRGRVGRVPWDFPETSWHQTFLGWSAPYFPTGVGGPS